MFVHSMRELRDWSDVKTRRRVGGATEVTNDVGDFSEGVWPVVTL